MSVDDHEILARVSLFGSTTYPHKKTKKKINKCTTYILGKLQTELTRCHGYFSWICSYWMRSIQGKFPEILVQNSVDRFGPTGKVSKKLFHLGPLFLVGIWLNGSRPLTFEQLSQVI